MVCHPSSLVYLVLQDKEEEKFWSIALEAPPPRRLIAYQPKNFTSKLTLSLTFHSQCEEYMVVTFVRAATACHKQHALQKRTHQ